jgi:hypothetical protein
MVGLIAGCVIPDILADIDPDKRCHAGHSQGGTMSTKGSRTQKGEPEFAEFWRNFRISPWRWVDALTGRSRYVVISMLIIYAVYAFMTYLPHNRWIAPLVTNRLIYSLGEDQILILKHYPSIHIFLFGFMVVAVLGILWRHQIPLIFQWLLGSGRLGSPGNDLKGEFQGYLEEYQAALLDNTKPLAISIFFLVLAFLISIIAGIPAFLSLFFTPMAVIVLYITIFVFLFWLFIIGQFSWVLYVTGRQIGKLTRKFRVDIQPGHPDKCGGLKPLGDFCFRAAIPLIGGGLLLSLIPVLNWDIDRVLSIMATTIILVLIGPLTALTVLIPVWDIHEKMAEEKRIYEDRHAAQRMTLEKIIRTHTGGKGNLKQAEIARQKYEILRTVDPEKMSYHVWPFRFTNTVLASFSPQIVAVIEIISKVSDLVRLESAG